MMPSTTSVILYVAPSRNPREGYTFGSDSARGRSRPRDVANPDSATIAGAPAHGSGFRYEIPKPAVKGKPRPAML